MNDSILYKEQVLKDAKRKLLLVADSQDRRYWLNNLGSAMFRDKTYTHWDRNSVAEILAVDSVLGTSFLVCCVCVNQWSWADKARGLIYDEVLMTKPASYNMEYPEELPSVVARTQRTGELSDIALFLLANNDPIAVNNLGGKLAVGENGGSMSEEFDFPMTLFRRDMLPYFEDWRNPTRDEFLFALTMEGICGNTCREKAAIEEAQLYVQGKGN